MTGIPPTAYAKSLPTYTPNAQRSGEQPIPSMEAWLTGGESTAGVPVNEYTALNYSAVFRAVSLISSCVSRLPMPVFRRVGERDRQRERSHVVDRLMNRRPNPEMNALTFREVLTAHTLLWGNGYAEIVRDGRGSPVELWPITPDKVMPDRHQKYGLGYHVSSSQGGPVWIPARDMLHVHGLGFDGCAGYSVVRYAREAIGLGIATEQSGSALFGNSSRPSGVLQHPQALKPDARKNLRESWESMHRGPKNTGRIAILEEGVQWKQLSIPPNDAQFLETRLFQVSEIARWFAIPPHMLAELSHATFSNIEHQGIEFLTYCLSYWLAKWEHSTADKLLTEAEQDDLYIEHITEALLRTDLKTRYDAYAIARNNGWMSANDVLRAENRPPIGEQGDVYLVPVNMVSAKEAAKPIPAGQERGALPSSPGQSPPEKKPAAMALAGVLSDAMGRMVRKFVLTCKTAAKHPSQFLARVEESSRKHADIAWRAYEAAFSAANLIHSEPLSKPGTVIAATVANEQFMRFHCELLELAGNVTPANLVAGVEKLTSQWIARIPEEVSNAMACYA